MIITFSLLGFPYSCVGHEKKKEENDRRESNRVVLLTFTCALREKRKAYMNDSLLGHFVCSELD